MSSDEQAGLAANAAFYDAFARRDLEAMDTLWARRSAIACIHPGWPALFGRETVMESWRAITAGAESPRITCSRARAFVSGDFAFVVCVEHLEGGQLVATNVFVREKAEWKLAHHHAGPAPLEAPDAAPERLH